MLRIAVSAASFILHRVLFSAWLRVKPVQALRGRRTSSRDRGSNKRRCKYYRSRPRAVAPFLFLSGDTAPSQAVPLTPTHGYPAPNRLRKNSSCTSDFIFSLPGTSSRTHYRGLLLPAFHKPPILTGENRDIYYTPRRAGIN